MHADQVLLLWLPVLLPPLQPTPPLLPPLTPDAGEEPRSTSPGTLGTLGC